MRLIDADALIDTIAIIAKKFAKTDAQKALMGRVMYIIEHKAEQVVRCKDCKHHEDEEMGMVYCTHIVGSWVAEDFFCADGERRSDD